MHVHHTDVYITNRTDTVRAINPTQVKNVEEISPFGLLFIETGDDVLRIDDGDDAVQLVHLLNVLIYEKGLNYRRGIGKASRLDEDPIEAFHALVELLERLHEVSTDGAADTAVHDLDDLLVDVLRQNFLVDSDVSKLVFDDGEFHPMSLVVENVVEQSGLARAPVEFDNVGDGSIESFEMRKGPTCKIGDIHE